MKRFDFLLTVTLTALMLASSANTSFAQDESQPPADAAPADAPAPVKTNKVGPGGPPPVTPGETVAPDGAPAEAKKPEPEPEKPKSKPKAPVAKGIYLSPLTPVSQSVHVHDKVLAECRLQSLLPQLIAERNSEIVLSEGSGAQKLELEIVDIHAPSGGVFSGPKWVTVKGRLLQGKTVKGSFVAKETSMASATACGMLSKVITVLAGDIDYWLENPRKNAMLGSAR